MSRNYSLDPEAVREAAVKKVYDERANYPSDWATIKAVSESFGGIAPRTLHQWVQQHRSDGRTPRNQPLPAAIADILRAQNEGKAAFNDGRDPWMANAYPPNGDSETEYLRTQFMEGYIDQRAAAAETAASTDHA